VLLLPGCDSGPQPINFGKDSCAECNMTIVDKRFGAEFVTGKGKVFKFDDVNCMVEFIERAPHSSDSSASASSSPSTKGAAGGVDQMVFVKHKKSARRCAATLRRFLTRPPRNRCLMTWAKAELS
jgi:hypothetical protein